MGQKLAAFDWLTSAALATAPDWSAGAVSLIVKGGMFWRVLTKTPRMDCSESEKGRKDGRKKRGTTQVFICENRFDAAGSIMVLQPYHFLFFHLPS